MLLNYTRLKHVCTTLRVSQIPCNGIRYISFSSLNLHNNCGLLRQPLLQLLIRPHRPYHQLFRLRQPAATAARQLLGSSSSTVASSSSLSVFGSRWSSRLLYLRRCLTTKAKGALTKNARGVTTPARRIKMGKSEYMRLYNLIKTEKWVLLVGLICLVVSSAITMCVPYFIGKVVDVVFNKNALDSAAMNKLREYSVMLFWIFALGGFANFARVYLFGSASLRIVRRLRSNLYRSMLLQEVGWYDSRGTGELVNRLSNDTYLVGISLSQNVSDGMRSIAMITVGSAMMIFTSPKLALVSAMVVPALATMAIVYGRYVRRITRVELDKYADIMKYAEERFGNVRTVKLFCREQKEVEDFNQKLNEALEIGYKETRARSIFFGLTGFSGNFIIISVLYYGGTLVLGDELTIGAMTSFLMYAGYVAVSMNGLSNFYSQMNKGIGASERIWEIFDRKYQIPIDLGHIPTNKVIGEVRFENVDFSYPSRPDTKVLTDFSLTLPAHKTTAIVGRSGSGKSTIALLLMRLYDPMMGAVYLDGVDVRTLNPQWLRRNVGAVSQEPVLFSGSIRSNILYGLDPGEAGNEQLLQQVVRDSNVIEFTQNLPDGLETIVGQRGMLLSGGQKQRVAIARALIKNPSILLLDEATSALDSVSEQLVQVALDKLIEGRTVLTIAHRLSTIHGADNIAVLDSGRVIEQGNYDTLMANPDGAFRELVSMQAFASGLPPARLGEYADAESEGERTPTRQPPTPPPGPPRR
ncbi:ATP-binding cassette sub-family B member 10, mitochondrial isoform X1 [Drosophila sulfurigaster albostrigata]|uniref:ATP-binding cassette sub-family B member 10, mitochondrial isoform X1 n=2 Tax=Drosophila sulfurigaster albostrigata TaxID=89887 RepID=UPI002D21E250|nr:ATP-binding cassette sub-family B member 10, mitochondrial isoform X1 [Drosophila sulfurigaster albostrigata]